MAKLSHLKLWIGCSFQIVFILTFGIGSARLVAQTSNSEQKKQAAPKDASKPPQKVWTNDDFPSAPTQPAETKAAESQSAGDNAASSEAVPPGGTVTPKAEGAKQPKQAEALAADAETAKYLKMTPEERKKLMEQDEIDLQVNDEEIATLRNKVSQAPDDTEYQRIVTSLAADQKSREATLHELQILRKLSQPSAATEDSSGNSAPPTKQ